MKTKKLISTLIIVLIAILMVTVALASVQAVDAAPKKVKVMWNANGGKIGVAKTTTTTVTKGAKVGKFPKTPKKVGYAFKGWYTKKSGGTKVTKVTKVKKNVIYYAQWKKEKRVLSTSEKKLVGTWCAGGSLNTYYLFRADGSFSCHHGDSSASPTRTVIRGHWRESGGTIYMTERTQTAWTGTFSPGNKKLTWKNVSNFNMNIRVGVNEFTGERAFVNVKEPTRYFTFKSPPSWVYF